MLVVGENTYITLEEAKDLCLDTSITALSDPELELIIKRAFRKLEMNYPVLKGEKLNPSQIANFPRNYQTEVPYNVKLAQVEMLSHSTANPSNEVGEIHSVKVGDVQTTFSNNSSRHSKINNIFYRVDKIMNEYLVKSI